MRAQCTPAAAELLTELAAANGPLMMHQSGGCCDGSAPMCYPAGEFIVGDRDVLLGRLDVAEGVEPVPVWISGSQFDVWRHTRLVIDVVPGRGSGFSLESPTGRRFLTRSRVLSAAEDAALVAPLTGAEVEAGASLPPASPPVPFEASDETCSPVVLPR